MHRLLAASAAGADSGVEWLDAQDAPAMATPTATMLWKRFMSVKVRDDCAWFTPMETVLVGKC